MFIITNKKKNIVVDTGNEVTYWDNGYPVIVEKDVAFVKEDVNVFEVNELPEDFEQGKYCYTEEKGFYVNPDYTYLNAVRQRAGIPDVKEAWDRYSTAGEGYYNNQTNMRSIIHQERMNELLFESQRFWDLRRWMEAPSEYGKNCYGFNIQAGDPADYYKKMLVYEQPFTQKDYFWPISRFNLERNKNLVQNLGWTE